MRSDLDFISNFSVYVVNRFVGHEQTKVASNGTVCNTNHTQTMGINLQVEWSSSKMMTSNTVPTPKPDIFARVIAARNKYNLCAEKICKQRLKIVESLHRASEKKTGPLFFCGTHKQSSNLSGGVNSVSFIIQQWRVFGVGCIGCCFRFRADAAHYRWDMHR